MLCTVQFVNFTETQNLLQKQYKLSATKRRKKNGEEKKYLKKYATFGQKKDESRNEVSR